MKAGDEVYGVSGNIYTERFIVDKVDNERGRVWGTDRYGKKKILSILEVTKVLDEEE